MKTQRRFKTVKQGINQQPVSSYPQIGETLKQRFKLIKKLGQGSFSITYKAIDTHNNDEPRTLKVYGKTTEVAKSLPDIKAETKTLTYLDHPTLPRCYGLHETEHVFLELEYVEAQTLEKKIGFSLSKADKISYAQQLAESLFHLHYKKIEHKDIKPENILITKDKKLYLIDFGVAALVNKNDDIGGTFEYCPPETIKKKEVKFKRDIFAYGIVLYQMFHGKYPFPRTDGVSPLSVAAISDRHINGRTPLVHTDDSQSSYKIPKHLLSSSNPYDKIIYKCLQYFPDDRYNSFQEIIDQLELAAKEAPTTIYKTIEKIIIKKIPVEKITTDFKKDLFYLWLNLLFLLMLLPFFIYFSKQDIPTERLTHINTSPHRFNTYVNGNYVGTSEADVVLKKGDIVTFTGTNDLPVFEMTVGNEKEIRISVDGNKMLLNNKIRGMILVSDEKIPRSVKFIALRGDIPAERLKEFRGSNLHVALASTAPISLINHLPENISSLSIKNNDNRINLRDLRRFGRLRSLDIEGSENIDINSMPDFENLENLNIKNTNTDNISSLSKLNALKHLNLESNNINELHTLLDNRNLESININNNRLLDSIAPLSWMSRLKEVKNNNPALQEQQQALQEQLDTQYQQGDKIQHVFESQKSNIYKIINVLVIISLVAIIAQMFKMGFKKYKPDVATTDKDNSDKLPASNNNSRKFESSLKTIDLAINDNKLYTPENDNALHYIFDSITNFPEESTLKQKKKDVLEMISAKTKDHLDRKEFEPIVLSSSAVQKYFPNRKSKKMMKKGKRKIPKADKLSWVFVKGGNYEMGDFLKNTVKLHEITIEDFKMSETIVTNKQYADFLNANGNKTEQGQTWIKLDSQYARIIQDKGVFTVKEPYASFPVYEVSWYGAQRFADWAGGRLPSEAEWEYAARAKGENILYACGNEIEKNKANFLVDPNDALWHSVFPAKSFTPNKLGLYEMSGNILEWCNDWYDPKYYEVSPKVNPIGPRNGELKVVRGGAWCFAKEQAYTFHRSALKPTSRNNYTGFRIVMKS